MKLWSDFYDMVLPDLPGVLNANVDIALRQSAIEFFTRTGAWRVWLDAQTTVLGQDVYDYDLPSGAQVDRLLRAKLGAEYLPVLRPDQANDSATGVLDMERVQFRLLPTPPEALEVATEVSLKPTQDATGLNDEHYSQYQGAIVHGALAKLMLSPKKPYTDPATGGVHAAAFDAACNLEAYKQFRGHSASTARVQAYYF